VFPLELSFAQIALLKAGSKLGLLLDDEVHFSFEFLIVHCEDLLKFATVYLTTRRARNWEKLIENKTDRWN
jgi:hypothetical protein